MPSASRRLAHSVITQMCMMLLPVCAGYAESKAFLTSPTRQAHSQTHQHASVHWKVMHSRVCTTCSQCPQALLTQSQRLNSRLACACTHVTHTCDMCAPVRHFTTHIHSVSWLTRVHSMLFQLMSCMVWTMCVSTSSCKFLLQPTYFTLQYK